jgi:aspartyl/asparaginyl-tRNA synthetase
MVACVRRNVYIWRCADVTQSAPTRNSLATVRGKQVKTVREGDEAASVKSAGESGGAGFNTRELVLGAGNRFAGRLPLRNLLETKPAGEAYFGQSVYVGGWTSNFRYSKKVAFIDLSDGSTHHVLQVVADAKTAGWASIESISRGASLLVRGTILATPKADQPFELQAAEIEILGLCDATTYPMTKPLHSLEHLRKIAHMRPRYPPLAAVMRVRNALAFATHTFYQQQGFVYVHAPIITASDCEGAGEMFQVEFVTQRAHAVG